MSSGRTRLDRARCYRTLAAVLTAQNPRKVRRITRRYAAAAAAAVVVVVVVRLRSRGVVSFVRSCRALADFTRSSSRARGHPSVQNDR